METVLFFVDFWKHIQSCFCALHCCWITAINVPDSELHIWEWKWEVPFSERGKFCFVDEFYWIVKWWERNMGQWKEWWLNVRRFSQTNARKQPVRASIEVCGAELLSIPFGTMVYFCFVVSCSILVSHHSCVFQRGQFIKVHKIPRLSWVGITLLKYVLYPKVSKMDLFWSVHV